MPNTFKVECGLKIFELSRRENNTTQRSRCIRILMDQEIGSFYPFFRADSERSHWVSVTLNAFVSYKWRGYRVGVNAYNLTDRLNYSQVFGNRATPSAGRTVILAVGATF